jgi:putative transposase
VIYETVRQWCLKFGQTDANELRRRHRNKHAAKRWFRKLLKELPYVSRVIVTDKLRSSGAAKRELLPGVEHRQHPGIEQPGGTLLPTHAAA